MIYGFDQLDGVDVFGYAFGHFLGVLHGVDHSGGSVGHVTAGEDTLAGGHAVWGLARQHVAAVVYLNAFGGVYDSRCGCGTHCHDHAVDGHHAAFAVLLYLDRFETQPFGTVDLHYVGVPHELHAFLHGIVIFGAEGRHAVDVAVVDDGHFRRAHAERGAGGVHSGVAASDDGDPVAFADHYLVALDEALVVEAHPAQEPYGLAHAGMLSALDVERLGAAGAGAHEDCVEAFVEEAVDGVVLADGGAVVDLHAEVFDLLYLAAHHFLRQTVFGNAEHQHSARLDTHLEYLHVESLAGEIAGDCQSGWAGADHRHASTGLLRDVLMAPSGLAVEVGYEALELADVDGLPLLGEDAVALALALMGADASAYCREVAAVVDDFYGVAEIAVGQFSDPVGDIVADGASLLASRHFAVEASLGLLDGFRKGIAFGYFLEFLVHYQGCLPIYARMPPST